MSAPWEEKASVRRETITCGAHIEDEQFREGWCAGGRQGNGSNHLRVAIDGTVVTAAPRESVSKFEIIAGRVERDGHMGRLRVAIPTFQVARDAAQLAQDSPRFYP